MSAWAGQMETSGRSRSSSLFSQELRNFLARLADRQYAVQVAVASIDLHLFNWCAVAFDHLRGLVHRVGMKDQIVIAGNEEDGRVDLLESLGEIAAARDKDLVGFDQIEEVVGMRR